MSYNYGYSWHTVSDASQYKPLNEWKVQCKGA